MVRTVPDGRTHIHRKQIVTTISRLPASGLEKNDMGKLQIRNRIQGAVGKGGGHG